MLNRLRVGDVSLQVACRAATPTVGPSRSCCTGYPESHLAWNALATAMVAEGFVVLAPRSTRLRRPEKPEPVDAYHVNNAAEDLLAVLEATAGARACC